MFKKKQRNPCDSQCMGARVAVAMSLLSWAVFILAWLWSPLMAHADTPLRSPTLGIELNSLTKTSAGGCRMNFILHNKMSSFIENLGFEVVLFDKGGRVANLLRLSGGALQRGKTRVRQFDLKGVGCGNISRVLINEITACKGSGLTPQICLKALNTTNHTKVAFGL